VECQGKAISDEKEAPLKSLCENSIPKLSPAGTAELQDDKERVTLPQASRLLGITKERATVP